MKEKSVKLGFRENDRKRIWKNYTKEIMNEKNDWDHITKANMAEGPIEKVSWEEITIAIKAMIPGRTPGTCTLCVEMISASKEVVMRVMMEL